MPFREEMRSDNVFVIGVDRVNRITGSLVAAAFAVMSVCTLLQVFVRFVMPKIGFVLSVPWTEELARYLMIWVVFLGAALACRNGQLIALDFVVNSLPRLAGRTVRMATTLLCLCFFLLLIWLGIEFMSWGMTEYSPVMTMPKVWVYLALPVSALLMVANTLVFAIAGKSTSTDDTAARVWSD